TDIACTWHAGRMQAGSLAGQGEHVGVAEGARSSVVVEEDVDVFVGRPAFRQTLGPVGRGLAAVAATRGGPSLVEAQVAPRRRAPQRRLAAGAVGQAEGGAVLLEQQAGL